MKTILSLAFAQDQFNYDEEVTFFGEKYRVIQYSTNFDVSLTEELIRKYDGHCDVICISGIPQKIKFKKGYFIHPDTYRLKTAARHTPLVDGQIIKDVYIPYALRMFHLKNPQFFTKKKVGMYSAGLQISFVEPLFELVGQNVVMADPFFLLKLPFMLHRQNSLETFLKTLAPVLKMMKVQKSVVPEFSERNRKINRALDEFLSCDIMVGNEANINFLDLAHLKNKSLIIDIVSPQFEKKLRQSGLKEALVCLPQFTENPKLNYSILEGIIQMKKKAGDFVTQDDVIRMVESMKLMPELRIFNDDRDDEVKFAFIIHPLSAKHIFKHPYLKFLKDHSKPLEKFAEEAMTYIPGFYYGKIDGVVSEKNGKKVKGLIYTVTETPKKLMESKPDVVYKKILKLCENAAEEGSKIIGLGAYTKIVGDAGVTIDRLSPIPVTTGNSLSAASTLWAAKLAVEKLGFVKKDGNQFKGTVMVVGATGSIGAVSAKILSLTWDKIIIAAPRAYKLIELRDEILNINPKAQIEISTNADNFSDQCDLIITTTSGQGKTVLDIMKVKPGCVICDVSRPFDIKEEEAVKRPDVLVIASGEVTLPGEVHIGADLGLEGKIVYACLAETALLAMDGKFESFTLSRNINYEKVLQIDKMAKEHGVRLSQIMGHNGFISDEEFNLCREHALQKIKKVSNE